MADQAATAFEATPQQPSNDPAAQTANESPKFYDMLVGEGKKFDGQEALAKGKYESDTYIEQLQSELKGLRTELETRVAAEESVDKLLQARESTPPQGEVPASSPQMSESDITELVKQTLVTTRTAETEQNNIDEADKALEVRFGDKRAEWLTSKAEELGVGRDFLQSIAATSPSLFLTTVGLDKAPESQGNPSAGSVNTEALHVAPVSTGAVPGTFKHYEEMRKTNPRAFWQPAIQQQLMKDRTEMGEEKFYG
mgnify:CR=1 FL=1|jgi:hypothetical protein|tara:strand:+ start:65 stop:826 length:762 start_codon:yes stop_codon:yes gene_type:complete